MNNEDVYSFLRSNGFKLIKKEASAFLGDYCKTFTDGHLQLRVSSSKSFETVDIRSNLPNENWYDLALVKSLLYNEKELNKILVIEEYILFLHKEFANIAVLFKERNYPSTKRRLEELGNERVQQMFPQIKE